MRHLKITLLFVASSVAGLTCAVLAVLAAPPAAAACAPLAADKGQSSGTLNVEKAGQYTLWLRMQAPKADSDSVYAQIDSLCPVNAGDSQSGGGFHWVNFKDGDPAGPMRYVLTAGPHTITLAGREAGAGVDRVMLVSEPDCVPVGLGDECLPGPAAGATHLQTTPKATNTFKSARFNMLIVGGCALAIAGAVGFMAWKYRVFMQMMTIQHNQPNGLVVGSGLHADVRLPGRLLHFLQHHKLIVSVCGAVIIVALLVGIVVAANSRASFEVEAGKLAGGAKVIALADASGGKYVIFENNPAGGSAAAGTAPQSAGGSAAGGGSSAGSAAGGSNSGGTSSGGGSSGGSSSCALPKYPDAGCTGVPSGTSLTVVNGDMNITVANTVVDGKDIRGCVTVTAPGVIIRNSKVSCSNGIVIASFGGAYSGTGLVVQDVEVSCNNTPGTAFGDTNFTARRVNIHGCENGFDLDGAITIEDSYIHDPYNSAVAHTDGIQLTNVAHDITISHNTIYSNDGTSAIISPSVGTVNILIQNNLLAGGAYTLYCRQNGSGTNYRVLNNHFSTIFYPTVGAYAPWTDCADEAQVTGNVYHESGLPVPF